MIRLPPRSTRTDTLFPYTTRFRSVAVLGGLLGPAHHVVAVDDRRLDHRVTPHPQHEQVALAGEVGGQGEGLLDVLLGQHVGAGGHVAHEGHVAYGTPVDRHTGGGVEAHFDGAGLGVVAEIGRASCRARGWQYV